MSAVAGDDRRRAERVGPRGQGPASIRNTVIATRDFNLAEVYTLAEVHGLVVVYDPRGYEYLLAFLRVGEPPPGGSPYSSGV